MDQNLTNQLFKSYLWAGFECTYALKRNGRMDQLSETMHDVYCREDYQMIKELGIYTVREGLSWNQIDQDGKYDFSRFEKMMEIGKQEGIQQIWDLNHFDFPEYLNPLSPEFVTKFGQYAQEAIKIIRKYQEGQLFIVPINEISFFAWIGGDVGLWAPFFQKETNLGWEYKKQLVKAALEAMREIRKVDSNVTFIQVDPLMRRIAGPRTSNAVKEYVESFKLERMQTWDMLSGTAYPELGGNKDMGFIGINYYYFNQEWVLNKIDKTTGQNVKWGIGWNTPNRVSVVEMLKDVYDRYHLPMVISETGGWGENRWRWWKRLIEELKEAREIGLPIYGVCAYPTVDRTDWEKGHLTNSGLWDFEEDDKKCRRIPHQKTIDILKKELVGKF